MPTSAADSSSDPGPTTVDSAGLGELMHAAFRGLRKRWMRQLAPFALTPHQFRALNAVARKAAGGKTDSLEARGVRLKDLADRLRIAPRSATEVVDQLQEKGLLQRTPDASDRRATLLSPTEAGLELRDKVLTDRRREADEYFSGLTPDDRDELHRILGLLASGA